MKVYCVFVNSKSKGKWLHEIFWNRTKANACVNVFYIDDGAASVETWEVN